MIYSDFPTNNIASCFFLQQISGRVCSQLDLSDIQSCRLRSFFDWHYAEHHDASIFPQVTRQGFFLSS